MIHSAVCEMCGGIVDCDDVDCTQSTGHLSIHPECLAAETESDGENER